MKKIVALFKKAWFVSLLAVLSLSLLIWFLGPLFGFGKSHPLDSITSRLVIIGILFALWGLYLLLHTLGKKRKEKALLQGIAETAEIDPNDQASQEEIEHLNQRMQDALQALQKARLGGEAGKQSLYELPWYMIIGPPGAGKTTLLANSNLHFPLSKTFGKDAIRGVGGTRNCDWWFTDEAVLLDTAGRYTTQDSNQVVDNKAWQGFLDLLKKHRDRRPINGVMLAISITDLLQQDETARLKQAEVLRQRIQELYEHFNIRFPIYVMFTKCDLLAGFNDYFDHMGRDERSQVWGMTFPLDEDSANDVTNKAKGNGKGNEKKTTTIALFNTEFDLLEKRLHQQIIPQLEKERDQARRQALYLFPQQFSSLQTLLDPFLHEIFRPTRFQHTAMLRGVYFTSATQEGSPIDRIMGALSRTFGMSQQRPAGVPSKGKSFFINHLLKKVVFHESGLAGTNTKLERKLKWLRLGALAMVAALSVLLITAWLTSFFLNRSMISDFERQTIELNDLVKAYRPEHDILTRLPMLNKAAALPSGYSDKYHADGSPNEDVPLLHTFGLYQGDKLGESAISKYRELLEKILLPPILADLEVKAREDLNDPNALFRVLRVYLMLQGKYRVHYNGESMIAFIEPRLKQQLEGQASEDEKRSLHKHLVALFRMQNIETGREEQPILPRDLDERLIAKARSNLADSNPAELAYHQAKGDLMITIESKFPDFTINEAAGPEASSVFVRRNKEKTLSDGISGLFTYEGFHKLFRQESKKVAAEAAASSWVLKTRPSRIATEPQAEGDAALAAAESERKKEEKKLRQQILSYYFHDYIQAWENLLADVAIQPLDSLEVAEEVLNLISNEKDSPLLLLLDKVRNHTHLDRAEGLVGDALSKKVGEKVNQAGSKAGIETTNSGDAARLTQQKRGVTARIVTARFKRLNALTEGKSATNIPLKKVLKQLAALHTHVVSADSSVSAGDEISELTRKKIDKLTATFKKKVADKNIKYKTVNMMLVEMVKDVRRLILIADLSQMDTVWKSEILPFCQSSIANKYPISRGGSEMTLQDFETFFAPNGKIDAFFKDYLQASIDTTTENWVWKGGNGSNQPSVAIEHIQLFQLAQKIKDAFFPTGKLGIPFTIKALNGGNKERIFSLDIDGKVITNEIRGKQVSAQWPNQGNEQIISQLFVTKTIPAEPAPTPPPVAEGGEGNPAPAPTVIVVAPPSEPKQELKTYDGRPINGPWAIFRLLEQHGRKKNDSTYRFTLSIQGSKASFELQAKSSASNPFKIKEQTLNLFTCPSSLL
ncbi:MAG TPA: type VI secretion system membrane subunit TssM [Thiothrix sp.]|nr:type VI secretion system membrane subunit TssM [Thiothrix sp.]